MKKIILPALLLGCGLFYLNAQNQPSKSEPEGKKGFIQSLVMSTLSRSHFAPVSIDDNFSKKAFNEYLDRVDYNKLFLFQSDIDELKEFELMIDDQIMGQRVDLFEKVNSIIEVREAEAKELYKEILSKPFYFDIEEEIETDAEKLNWVNSKSEWKERWRKRLKAATLSRLEGKYRNQQEKLEKDSETEEKSFEFLEKSAREKTLKGNENWFDRLAKLKEEDKFEMYMNSMVNIFDPHSVYFAPKSKENFDISMSGKLEGIGARLSQSDGEIKISEVIPGSPCDLQGDLEVEDIILKAAEENKEATDLSDMLLDEAVQYIRGKKGTTVRLTVKKIDGSLQDIDIVRDVVVNRETYAKSALIEKENKTFGYIKLPKFYADFQNRGGRNSSGDMEKEILKLKKENVDGVLIDLRSNGGGSLEDVVKIAGLFIDKGPIVQVNAGKSNRVKKDVDPKIYYDGPLVIMVDKFSASASEILAAAMQDYGRAVIVGSEQTFGKGTVQHFIDFDRQINAYHQFKPMGSLKITAQKFYRVNGGSTQIKGVESDVVLPDNYSYIDLGEGERDFAMAWDQIDAVKYSSKDDVDGQLKEIKKNSKKRVANHNSFAIIDEHAKDLKARKDDSKVTLSWEKYLVEQAEIKAKNKELKESKKNRELLEVSNMETDMSSINSDSTFIKLNDKWIKSLEKDIYLEEAVKVLMDIK